MNFTVNARCGGFSPLHHYARAERDGRAAPPRCSAEPEPETEREREREREGGRTQCLEPVFPFKVASFCSLTGHEYQAEGAERKADTEPTRLLLQSTENTTDCTPAESELRI